MTDAEIKLACSQILKRDSVFDKRDFGSYSSCSSKEEIVRNSLKMEFGCFCGKSASTSEFQSDHKCNFEKTKNSFKKLFDFICFDSVGAKAAVHDPELRQNHPSLTPLDRFRIARQQCISGYSAADGYHGDKCDGLGAVNSLIATSETSGYHCFDFRTKTMSDGYFKGQRVIELGRSTDPIARSFLLKETCSHTAFVMIDTDIVAIGGCVHFWIVHRRKQQPNVNKKKKSSGRGLGGFALGHDLSLPSIHAVADRLLKSIFGYACTFLFCHAFLLKDPDTSPKNPVWYIVKADCQATAKVHKEAAGDRRHEKVVVDRNTGVGGVFAGANPKPHSYSEMESRLNIGRQTVIPRVSIADEIRERLEISDRAVGAEVAKFEQFIAGKTSIFVQDYMRDFCFDNRQYSQSVLSTPASHFINHMATGFGPSMLGDLNKWYQVRNFLENLNCFWPIQHVQSPKILKNFKILRVFI